MAQNDKVFTRNQTEGGAETVKIRDLERFLEDNSVRT